MLLFFLYIYNLTVYFDAYCKVDISSSSTVFHFNHRFAKS